MTKENYLIDCKQVLKTDMSHDTIIKKCEDFFGLPYYQDIFSWASDVYPYIIITAKTAGNCLTGTTTTTPFGMTDSIVINWYNLNNYLSDLQQTIETQKFNEELL